MSSAEQAQELTLIDHLVELRDRLLKCLAAVVICFIALFAFSADIYSYVAEPSLAHYPKTRA